MVPDANRTRDLDRRKELLDALDGAVPRLRRQMKAEMTSGFDNAPVRKDPILPQRSALSSREDR